MEDWVKLSIRFWPKQVAAMDKVVAEGKAATRSEAVRWCIDNATAGGSGDGEDGWRDRYVALLESQLATTQAQLALALGRSQATALPDGGMVEAVVWEDGEETFNGRITAEDAQRRFDEHAAKMAKRKKAKKKRK